MTYRVVISIGDYDNYGKTQPEITSAIISTDEELYAFLGRACICCFLSLDRVDWQDAFAMGQTSADALLHFTATKANDYEGHGNRHGLVRGLLATGKAVYEGKDADINVFCHDVK